VETFVKGGVFWVVFRQRRWQQVRI
jgi:hypothetical protein